MCLGACLSNPDITPLPRVLAANAVHGQVSNINQTLSWFYNATVLLAKYAPAPSVSGTGIA